MFLKLKQAVNAVAKCMSFVNKADPNCPQAYIDGHIQFCGIDFKVNQYTLIPRIETEDLVNEIIKLNINNMRMLDVGTGSGCIAVSVAKNLPDSTIWATDLSEQALTVAKYNAKKHKVDSQIKFVKNDLLDNLNLQVDIIAANLPYIPSERIAKLDNSVKDFEPHQALNGGSDGFELYRNLFDQISKLTTKPKYIFIEIDDTQGQIAIKEAQKYFPTAKIELKQDFTHLDRMLLISM